MRTSTAFRVSMGSCNARARLPVALLLVSTLAWTTAPTDAQTSATHFNDSHFHLTNYVQDGIDIRRFLQIMGTRVGRSTLFGIPLQQTRSYANAGEYAPTAAERNPAQFVLVEAMLTDPTLNHVSFHISWDEVAKYAVASPQSIARVVTSLNRHPDRFLFGTDTVAPAGPEPYFAVYDLWDPIWKQLTSDASLKVRKTNYERLFNAARQRIRAWERAHVS